MDVTSLSPERLRRVSERENRKRATRACDYCRRQKEKCDGNHPCKRCSRLYRQCVFSTPHQSGRQVDAAAADAGPEAASTCVAERSQYRMQCGADHPRSRESSAMTTSRAAGQRMALLESIVKRVLGTADLSMDNLKQAATCTEAQNTLSIPADDRPRQPGQSIVEEPYTVRSVGNNVTHYSGEFSHWNFSMRIKDWLARSLPADQPRDSLNSFTDFYRSEELQSPLIVSSSVSSLPPRSVANFLAHCFFKYAEANYFTVEKEWFEAKLSVVYADDSTLNSTAAGTVCIVFAVLAIGTQYAYLESSTKRSQGSPTNEATGLFSFTEDAVGIMFYHQACRLLSEVITLSSLESIQACLLLGIYALPIDASGLAYVYLNIGLKLGIQNGMHRKSNENAQDRMDDSIKNRVWWSVYCLERRIGIFHGRPLSLNDHEMDIDLPSERLDAWPSASRAHADFHSGTVKLVGMLSRVCHEISVLKTSAGVQTNGALRRLDRLRCDLLDWGKILPEAASPQDPPSHLLDFRRGLHLKLEYCLVRMFAGRCFIFTDLGCKKSPSTEQGSRSSHTSIVQGLVTDCIDAALLAMDTCRFLDSTVGLARASYTEFSSCRAALLIVTTQCLQTRNPIYRQTLREGLTMLKKMAHGSRSAHTEMSLIEGFERVIARLDETEETSTYARFKQWENAWKDGLSTVDPLHESSGESQLLAASARSDTAPNAFSSSVNLPTPTSMPFFGTATDFSSFPQTQEDWSTFMDYGFASNSGMNFN